jgi:hypothetical protein
LKTWNDSNEADRLAKLQFLGETPTLQVPSPEVRSWREYGRFERPLVQHVNAVILQIARCDHETDKALRASV